MLSKEEIEKIKENSYWQGYIQKQNEAMEICKQCKYIKKVKQLKSDKQKLIEKLEEDNEEDRHTVQIYAKMYRNATENFQKRSYRRSIDMASASIETRKGVLSILRGENHE